MISCCSASAIPSHARLEVLDAGDPEPREFAPGADIRTDIPRYRVYRQGTLADEVMISRHTGGMIW